LEPLQLPEAKRHQNAENHQRSKTGGDQATPFTGAHSNSPEDKNAEALPSAFLYSETQS
jgi:hypothetical protein